MILYNLLAPVNTLAGPSSPEGLPPTNGSSGGFLFG